MAREKEDLTSMSQQAAYWWVTLRDVDAADDEKREFAEWVTHAPECVEACLRVARVHAAVSRRDVRWPQDRVEATPGGLAPKTNVAFLGYSKSRIP